MKAGSFFEGTKPPDSGYLIPVAAQKTSRSPPLGVTCLLVPLTGIEPVRILLRGILSPLCLPIPPQRHICSIVLKSDRALIVLLRCPVSSSPSSGFLVHRPLPLAQVASSATGGAPIAPHHSGISLLNANPMLSHFCLTVKQMFFIFHAVVKPIATQKILG